MTRAVVFAYHNVGVRCLQGAARARRRGPAGGHARRRSRRDDLVRAASPAPPAEYGIAAIAPDDPNAADVVARVAARAPGLPLLVLLPADARRARCWRSRRAARSTCTARCCRSTAAARRSTGRSSHGETRDRRDAALHDRQARRRRHRRADGGADPARRHRARSLRQGDRRGRDRRSTACCRRCSRAPRRGMPQDLAHGSVLRRAQARRRRHRLDARARPRSTTWCARSRRPIPARSRLIGGHPARLLRTRVLDADGAAGHRAARSTSSTGALPSRCGGGGVLQVLELEIDGAR